MFIVFEGIDASGKSTLMRALLIELDRRELQYICTREPGGTPFAEDIRNLLLKKGEEAPVPRCELLLYEASRAQHVESVIRPALLDRKWVICDRFTASSLAFQCGGRGVSEEEVEYLNNYAIDGCAPDLTVLIDISLEESERRKNQREKETGIEKDRFEVEKREFHKKVKEHYLKQAKAEGDKWLVLNGETPVEELLESLIERVF